MKKSTILAAVASAGLTLAAVPAAHAQANGLVAVNVTDVDILRNSLNNNDVDVLNNLLNNNQVAVPVVLQVPVAIAANVCGTTVALLSAAGSAAKCNAEAPSRALGQIINRQVLTRPTTTTR